MRTLHIFVWIGLSLTEVLGLDVVKGERCIFRVQSKSSVTSGVPKDISYWREVLV